MRRYQQGYSRMKVTVIGPVFPYRGGIAHHTTLLVQNLKSKGHSVQVISFKRQYPAGLYPGKTDQDPSQQPLKVDADFILDPLYPWTWCQSAQQITNFQPELVLIQWWTTFWALAYSSLTSRLRRNGIRIGYLIHNVLPHENRFLDRTLARMALQKANIFLVQSKNECERLRQLLPEAVIKHAPLPVFDMFSDQPPPFDLARQRLNLPPEAKILLFFGIVRPYKGLTILLEAVSMLRKQDDNVYLIVAGEFWGGKKDYQEQIDRLMIAGCVRMDDRYIPNEDIPFYFSAADLLVAPYLSGTQSAAVKISLGFGLPAIITLPIMDEILSGRSDISVVPPGNAVKLKDAIAEFFNRGRLTKVAQVDNGWARVVDIIENMVIPDL
jgi:glycosyltransferase involved in cell wall biosynthesis